MLNYPVGKLQKPFDMGRPANASLQILDYNRVADVVQNRINHQVERWPDDTIAHIPAESLAREIGLEISVVRKISLAVCGNEAAFLVCKGDEARARSKAGMALTPAAV